MKTVQELTIVIPCKNEEKYIEKLFDSLLQQTYTIKKVKIVVADAHSTDNTKSIIKAYQKKLNISIVPGGLPSRGRNAGAKKATTHYILFLDADITLGTPTLIKNALNIMKEKHWKCATCDIKCRGDLRASCIYVFNNLIQHLSKYKEPFASGMFMLFERRKFQQLGGFNEKILYAEDYALTKQLQRKEFGIVPGQIYATNRRFKKMGYWKIIAMFVKTALNANNESYFLKKEHGNYWK